MTTKELLHKAYDEPFKPFRMRLTDRRTFDVLHPGMVLVGPTRAVVALRNTFDEDGNRQNTDWREISIADIEELTSLQAQRSNGKRRRR
jgi:hypothetical protein